METLLPSFIFGVIGFWLFKRAKEKANFYLLGIAVALMAYPYFTDSVWLTWALGAALCGAAKVSWYWDP